MTTRFVTVGDDLTLPADVVVPVAQVHGAGTAFETFDVTGPGTSNDQQRFIDTAAAVAATGRKTLRVAPGTYAIAGLTPADISNLYVVGDGVSLPGAFVYPFTTQEWVSQSATRTVGRGGRGVVAFEVDDALPEHWTDLFPLTKELGITMGTSWHTSNGAKWITEAHRHGWEVMFHLSRDIQATTLTEEQLDAEAVAGLNAIEAATGQRENIGFVYPQHARTVETDRILSKYFTRGRGVGSAYAYPKGGGRTWLTSAYPLDTHLAGGTVSEAAKDILRSVANTDARLVMYLHFNSVNKTTHAAALRELVTFIREQGIEIANPAQVWGARNLIADPYDDRNAFILSNANLSRSTERKYHGDHSIKFTAPSAGPSVGTIRDTPRLIASRPGMFSVWRASVRHNTDGAAVSSPGQGIGFLAAVQYRTLAGGLTSGIFVETTRLFPYTGTTIPAASWARIAEPIYLGPAAQFVTLATVAQNIVGGGVIYFDEMKFELLDYVSQVTQTATLAGTGNVVVYPNVPNLTRYPVQVTPLTPMNGKLNVTVTDTRVTVSSTDPTDTTQKVLVTVLPGPSYADMVLPATGA